MHENSKSLPIDNPAPEFCCPASMRQQASTDCSTAYLSLSSSDPQTRFPDRSRRAVIEGQISIAWQEGFNNAAMVCSSVTNVLSMWLLRHYCSAELTCSSKMTPPDCLSSATTSTSGRLPALPSAVATTTCFLNQRGAPTTSSSSTPSTRPIPTLQKKCRRGAGGVRLQSWAMTRWTMA